MVAIVLNGLTGARLHIPFPVLNRSSMGFCLSCQYCIFASLFSSALTFPADWSIFSRAILACFWMGIQGANGGECVTQMIRVRIKLSNITYVLKLVVIGYLA